MTITIDLIQVGAGVLLGFVLGALTKIRALRRLDMNIQKIGFNMGVKGIEAPETSAGQSIWRSTIGGDVVGRDKTTNIGKQIQKILGAPLTGPTIKLRTSMSLTTKDAEFREHLKRISDNRDSSDAEFISACLERAEFAEPIQQRILDLAKKGCRVVSATVDRSGDGFMLAFDVQKAI